MRKQRALRARFGTTVKIVAALTCLAGSIAQPAFAGHAIGAVTYLNASTGPGGRSIAHVMVNGYVQPPACTGTPTGFALYIDTPTGRAQFAMLLSAWQAGTAVGVAGGNGCSIHSSLEDVSHVDVAVGCCGR